MRPYWIKVERQSKPTLLNLGVGVTASSEAEARRIFACAFRDIAIESVTPVADISSLDQGMSCRTWGTGFSGVSGSQRATKIQTETLPDAAEM